MLIEIKRTHKLLIIIMFSLSDFACNNCFLLIKLINGKYIVSEAAWSPPIYQFGLKCIKTFLIKGEGSLAEVLFPIFFSDCSVSLVLCGLFDCVFSLCVCVCVCATAVPFAFGAFSFLWRHRRAYRQNNVPRRQTDVFLEKSQTALRNVKNNYCGCIEIHE